MPRRNDYRPMADTFAWLDEREEWFFATYLDRDSLRYVIDELREQSEWPLARDTVYKWLQDDEQRWARWQQCVELQGHFSRDEAMSIAANATQKTANADRLRYEAKRWSAEVQNRRAYGKQTSVNLQVGPGQEWLDAMKAVVASTEAEQLPEASYELLPADEHPSPGQDPSADSPARASGIAERETGADASDE